MANRFEQPSEGVWRVGEIRTVKIVHHDIGWQREAEYTVTEDWKIFGPVNERWVRIPGSTIITPRPVITSLHPLHPNQ